MSRSPACVGTYTDPRHIIAYTNGEVRRQFSIGYTARITGGELAISDESTEIRFVDPGELRQPSHAPHAATPDRTLPVRDATPRFWVSQTRYSLSALRSGFGRVRGGHCFYRGARRGACRFRPKPVACHLKAARH